MAEIPRKRRRWVLPSVLVVLGVLMMVVGSFRQPVYASSVWLELGAALALFGPLYWAQWMLERGITEVRQQGRETRSSVEELSHEIEAIREETAASLDDLRKVTLEHVQQRRRTDEDAFRRFRQDPTFENITELINRAQLLGGISKRGVRVRLPGTSFRLRFPMPAGLDNGSPLVLEVGLEEEDGTRPHDATGPRIAMRGQRPIRWSAGQTASEWAASMAAELQALNRYPGDEQFDPSGALEQLMSLLSGSLLIRVGCRGGAAGRWPRRQAAAAAAGAAALATTTASTAVARCRGSARPAPPATPPARRS
jgi:hypothetical protein